LNVIINLMPVIDSGDAGNLLTITFIVLIVDQETLVANLCTIKGMMGLILDPIGWAISFQVGSLALGQSHTVEGIKDSTAKDLIEILPSTQPGLLIGIAGRDGYELESIIVKPVNVIQDTG
jgi:hypothetical protein